MSHLVCGEGAAGSPLLDLGDVSQDLEALSPAPAQLWSEDSAAEHDYENLSSPGGSSTCSGPTYRRHLGFGPDLARSQPPASHCGKVEDVLSISPPSPLKQAASLPSRHRLSSQTSLEPTPKEARKKKKKNLLCPSYDENQDQTNRNSQNERVSTKIGGGRFGGSTSRSRHKKGDQSNNFSL